MVRMLAPALCAIALIVGLIGGSPAPSGAVQESASPAASSSPGGICPPGSFEHWDTADVRPTGPLDADVVPAAELTTGEPAPVRHLYLVEIRLPPGGCMPYVSQGNQKDGAIVMIVQQGFILYQWEPISGTTPNVKHGDSSGGAATVTAGAPQPLYPGDWITQDQKVLFSYLNAGSDTAIILKAVWAAPDGGGCGGGCK